MTVTMTTMMTFSISKGGLQVVQCFQWLQMAVALENSGANASVASKAVLFSMCHAELFVLHCVHTAFTGTTMVQDAQYLTCIRPQYPCQASLWNFPRIDWDTLQWGPPMGKGRHISDGQDSLSPVTQPLPPPKKNTATLCKVCA